MGGEHPPESGEVWVWDGSSPRGRGTYLSRPHNFPTCRFIPAWAGNISRGLVESPCHSVHPRVGGEHRYGRHCICSIAGSSPRGRGTCADLSCAPPLPRFIPAWAGNMRYRTTATTRPTVHPRVGGEHARGPTGTNSRAGSSPRGRGTFKTDDVIHDQGRFIPAWAGNMR